MVSLRMNINLTREEKGGRRGGGKGDKKFILQGGIILMRERMREREIDR